MPSTPPTHKPMKRLTKRHGESEEQWGKGRGGRPWRRKRQRVFERDGYLCQICLEQGKEKYVTLHGSLSGVCDHIIPKSQGGSDDESNLQAICQACDKIKTGIESNFYKKNEKGRGV